MLPAAIPAGMTPPSRESGSRPTATTSGELAAVLPGLERSPFCPACLLGTHAISKLRHTLTHTPHPPCSFVARYGVLFETSKGPEVQYR